MDEKELEKLWQAMGSHFDVGDFSTFRQKMQTPQQRKSFYDAANTHGVDLGNFDEYEGRLSGNQKKNPVGNDGSTTLSNTNSVGATPSTSNEENNSHIPTVDLSDNTPEDNIDLAKKYGQLQESLLKNMVTGIGDITSTMSGIVNAKESKDLRDFLIDTRGVDNPEQLYKETGRLTDEDYFRVPKEQLLEHYENNKPLYSREVSHLNWRKDLGNEIASQVDKGNLAPEEAHGIDNNIQSMIHAAGSGQYSDQRDKMQNIAGYINTLGGENKDDIQKNFAVEASKVYGNAMQNGFDKTAADTPESKYLTSPNAQLGYQYIKDMSPDRAAQYERLFTDPKKLEGDELKGYNHLMQTLEETGIGLQQNAVAEDLNDLNNKAKNRPLSPEELDKFGKLQEQNNKLYQQQNELDDKYPDRLKNKIDDAMQEIMGQSIGWGNYAGGKTGLAFKHTAQGIWEAVSSPFMSDESNSHRELALMGQNLDENETYHLTDENKSFKNDALVIEPDLQKQIDAIVNEKNPKTEYGIAGAISDARFKADKQERLYRLLYNNKDKFNRVPLTNGKFDPSPSSILYGVTDITTSLVPFMAVEAATGGIGGTGQLANFVRTANAAFVTSFHDHYTEAVMDGKSQADAYKQAFGTTAIDAAAMGGAQTAAAVRGLYKEGSTAYKVLSQMSDEAIEKQLAKGVPKGLKGIGQVIKDKISATAKMVGEGVKTGAKFEVAQTVANEAKHQIYNTDIDREQNFKQSLLNIANFGIIGAGLGHIGYEAPSELQKSGLVEFGKKPDEYLAVADQMKKNGQLTQEQYDHRIKLISLSKEAYKNLPVANDKGEPLNQKEQGEYLYNTVLKNEGNKAKSTLPPKQAEKAEMTAMVADHKNDLILNPQTDNQLESRRSKLEKLLDKKDDNDKYILNDKERKDAQAELTAITEHIEDRKKEADTKLSKPIEGLDEQGIPTGDNVPPEVKGTPEEISKPIELNIEPNEATTENTQAGTSSPESEQPEENVPTEAKPTESVPETTIEEGSGKEIGTKKRLNDALREEMGLQPLELPKHLTANESVVKGKELVDSGKNNPLETIAHLLDHKDDPNSAHISPEDEMGMLYYERQLSAERDNLQATKIDLEDRIKAEPDNEETKGDLATVTQKLLNNYDAEERRLNASQIAGNVWSKYGLTRQTVVDERGQVINSIDRIKTIYGDEMPEEIKKQLSDLQQKYDDLTARNQKIEKEHSDLQAENELLKQTAAKKKDLFGTKRAKKTDADFAKERTDILAKMKEDVAKMKGATFVTVPGFPQLGAAAPHIMSLFRNLAEQGLNKIDDVVEKIHELVKDVVDGISKNDIRDIIAGKYNDTTTRSDLVKRIYDLQTQARLQVKIKELEDGIIRAAKKKGEQSEEVKKLQKKLDELRSNLPKPDKIENVDNSIDGIKKQIQQIKQKIRKGQFSKTPPEKKLYEKNDSWIKNNQELIKVKKQLRDLEYNAYQSHKSMYMRGLDWVNRWGRRVIFFGANAVYTKLSSAAVLGSFVHRIPEQIAGKINTKLYPHIAKNASIEGYINSAAEAKFYLEFINPKKFIKNTWQIGKTGESNLSKELSSYTQKHHIPILDLFAADAHIMLKDPVKRATFEAAMVNTMKYYAENNIDGAHPLLLEAARQAAYKTAESEIFQNNPKQANKVSQFFKELEKSGVLNNEKPDPWSKVKGNAQYTLASLYHFFVPVNTVPLNIVKRVWQGNPVSSIIRTGKAWAQNKAIREGILNLSQDEANHIMNQLKKGRIGSAYWTLGLVLGASALGGAYSKYNPDNKKTGLKADEMKVGSVDVPKDVQHNTQLQSAQMGATYRNVYDHYINDKGASVIEASVAALAATGGALVEGIPTVKEGEKIVGALRNPSEGKAFVTDLKRRIGLGKGMSLLQMMGYASTDEPSVSFSDEDKTKPENKSLIDNGIKLEVPQDKSKYKVNGEELSDEKWSTFQEEWKKSFDEQNKELYDNGIEYDAPSNKGNGISKEARTETIKFNTDTDKKNAIGILKNEAKTQDSNISDERAEKIASEKYDKLLQEHVSSMKTKANDTAREKIGGKGVKL